MSDVAKRKHDATGRSSLPKDNKERQRSVRSPPEGEPWVFHTLSLLNSDAWKYRSVTLARLLDFLEIEHLAHGGSQNGFLAAPFNQLEAYGLARRLISKAIQEGERRGLLRVTRSRKKGQTLHEVNRFRLTYFAHRTSVDDTSWFTRPSNEWQRFVEPAPVSQSPLGRCTKVHLVGAQSPLGQSENAVNAGFEQVDESPQPSIFLGDTSSEIEAQTGASNQWASTPASTLEVEAKSLLPSLPTHKTPFNSDFDGLRPISSVVSDNGKFLGMTFKVFPQSQSESLAATKAA